MAKKKNIDGYQIFCFAFLLIFGLILLYPVIYAIVGSLTTQAEIDLATKAVFPKVKDIGKNISNYIVIFSTEGLLTSLIVSTVRFIWHLILGVFTAVLFGYIFARMQFFGKPVFFLILMGSMMIPGVAMTVPNFIYLSQLSFFGADGLINNPAILFVTGLISVYNIFLVRQSVSQINAEIEEAAEVDGAGFLRIVFGIYLPLLKPVVAVIFINMFAGHWSDYTTSLVYLANCPEWWTIGYRITEVMEYFVSPMARDFPKMYASAIMAMIPPIIAFICVQDSFIEGLSLGGVKG